MIVIVISVIQPSMVLVLPHSGIMIELHILAPLKLDVAV